MASPTAHAYLSASGAVRWLNCPPLVSIEAGIPNKDTVYTQEGTQAHALAELKLKYETGKIKKATFTRNHNKFKKENDFYDEEMEEATDIYVGSVMEHVNAYDDPEVELELRVDFSKWVPKGYGTSDVVIMTDNVIEIIDLKYGKGVPVSAYQNPQMMLYALGAYNVADIFYDFEIVRMTIMQPRLDSISTFELSVEELLYWAENYVAPRASQAYDGIGDWNITKDVMRFSKVRGQLVPQAAANFEFLDKHEYEEPALLTGEQVAEILAKQEEIEQWLKDVNAYALSKVLSGEDVPGYKVVEGRSNRKITDPDEAGATLEASGYENIYKPKQLESLTKLEKIVGKKELSDLLGDYIVKPEGKPTLAPVSDKRPPVNDADADFN